MKKLLLGICYCFLSSLSFSQTIRGTILDSTSGEPVAAATVELGRSLTVISASDGTFQFGRVPSNIQELRVTVVGYRPYEIRVDPRQPLPLIRLQRFNLFMEPVEVVALRAGDRAPFTKTNITRQEIRKQNLGQDMPFILNQTPSVVINSDAGNGVGYTGIRIRGSDATRINMTINGIPYNDAESQGIFFVNLPDLASSVDNIQIQRGVGTSSNGPGAFGATMNFSTNEVNTEAYAELNNTVGSFNTWRHTVKAGSGLLGDHFTIDARLSKISSDGYVERASTDLQSFYLSGAYLSNKTSLRFNIMSGRERTYQAWYGVSEEDLQNNRRINYAGLDRPGGPYRNETDNYQQDHYQFFVNHQLNSRITLNTAFFLTNGRGYYEQYRADESYEDYNLPDFIRGGDTMSGVNLIRQLWLDNTYYGQIFSARYKDDRNELTVGGGWNRYSGDHFGEVIWASAGIPDNYRWYDLPAQKNDLNIYAKYQRRLFGRLEGFADLQYRRVLYDLNGFRNNPDIFISNTYNFFNPKFGLTYVGDGYQFYGSYSKGTKEPVRDDFEAGIRQQPLPEKLHDFELGWEMRKPGYQLGTTLYYMQYQNQLVLTGAINDVGAYTRTNTPESFRMGIELTGKSKLTDWMNFSGNLTLSRNRIQNFTEFYDDYDNGGQKFIVHGNTDISFSPAVTAAASLDFRFNGFEINLPAKYVSRQYLDNTSNLARSLDPFYVQDVRLMYTLRTRAVREINFVLQVNNVFNRMYEPNGYTFSYQAGGVLNTENYYFPMAGTNVLGGVNIRL